MITLHEFASNLDKKKQILIEQTKKLTSLLKRTEAMFAEIKESRYVYYVLICTGQAHMICDSPTKLPISTGYDTDESSFHKQ